MVKTRQMALPHCSKIQVVESDSLRECRPSLWHGTGDSPRHHPADTRALLPVSYRPLGCRQDDTATPAVPVPEAHTRTHHHFRQGPVTHTPRGTSASAAA